MKKWLPLIIIPALMLVFSLYLDRSTTGHAMLYCAISTLCIHIMIGLPSVYHQSERFYDLTGTIAVLGLLMTSAQYSPSPLSARSMLLIALCLLWTLRLGGFLFFRIVKHKKDSRFDQIKTDPIQFSVAWLLSAAWTFITLSGALIAITSSQQTALNAQDAALLCAWIAAFSLEAIADWQKLRFKQQKNTVPFIRHGLWRYSRHPNYFGEILMWIFVAGLSIPNDLNQAYFFLLSPIFVIYLLTRISGIPLLEAENDRKFGHLKTYQAYKKNTPQLIPFVFWP